MLSLNTTPGEDLFFKSHLFFSEYRGNQNSVKWADSVNPDMKGQDGLIDITQMVILFEEM